MPAIAQRLNNVTVSASLAMTQKARDLAAQGIKVISLSSGEPDFPTPAHAVEAAHAAALAGDTKYPPADGTPALRAAIQRKFKRDNNLDYDTSQILVAGGGKQIIFNAIMATCDPGDEVVIPAPSWSSYADIVKFSGAVGVMVVCLVNIGLRVWVYDLESDLIVNIKWLLLNLL
jgi:aspartate aminotransferase